MATRVLNFGKEVKDPVVLKIGGRDYDGFEEMRISRSLDTLSASFQVSFADKWRQSGETWPLKPGEPVCVNVGSTQIMNGFIDRLDVSVSNEDRKLEVNGRDVTADLVDCSAGVNTQTQFINSDLQTIADSYATLFGLNLAVEGDIGGPFPKVSSEQNETVFSFLNRLAKQRGVYLTTGLDGRLILANRASATASLPSISNPVASFDFVGALKGLLTAGNDVVQSQNILRASATYDETDRFQNYVVKGQSKGSDTFSGLAANQVAAAAIDSGVSRFRPKVIIADNQITVAEAQQRAGWESITRAAQAVQIQIEVNGFKDGNDEIWDTNTLLNLEAGFIGVEPSTQLLITGVEFTKRRQSGTITRLTLTRPDAYQAKPVVAATNDIKQSLGWENKVLSSTFNRINEVVR